MFTVYIRRSCWMVGYFFTGIVLLTFVLFVAQSMLKHVKRPATFSTVLPGDIAATNAVRANCDIRQIHSDWSFYGREFNADKWKLKAGDDSLAKVVQRGPQESILWEEDYYFSGATFVHPHAGAGPDWEHLTIHYDYSTLEFYISYSGVNSHALADIKTLNLIHKGYKGASNQETLQVADSILRQWNGKRL